IKPVLDILPLHRFLLSMPVSFVADAHGAVGRFSGLSGWLNPAMRWYLLRQSGKSFSFPSRFATRGPHFLLTPRRASCRRRQRTAVTDVSIARKAGANRRSGLVWARIK